SFTWSSITAAADALKDGFGWQVGFFWRAIWKLDTLSKIHVFTWRMGNEILPTNLKIASVRRGFGQACPRCGTDYETLAKAIWERAIMLSKEFRIHNLLNVPIIFAQLDRKKWDKPPKNCIIINFDASTGNNRTGYRVIVRDDNGFVLGGGGGFKDVQLLRRLSGLVNKINGQKRDLTIIGSWIKDSLKALANF
ncbi:hypothetical protein Golob_021906, partial [Gossypium lobatum]|nr:hypothetical protein [Gossypium lobatum]